MQKEGASEGDRMKDEEAVQAAVRAIEAAHEAWDNAHRDRGSNPMTRTAAIPGTGILAAAILDQPGCEPELLTAQAERAVAIARRAWDLTHRDPPGNPIAATAEKSVIGIVAAGVLRYLLAHEGAPGE
jgi:hypothetical protein